MTTAASPGDARPLTPAQQQISDIWDLHMRDEFVVKDADATMTTMTDDPVVNHVPVLTGGVGPDEVRAFYAESFIPQMPPDFTVTPVSRTIGDERVVDELVISFTHTVPMAWMLPGLAPTGRRVEAAFVVVVTVRDGKVAAEHIYWDQASVLVQLGLIDPAILPVMGAESARKILDPSLPANALIARNGVANA